MKKSIDNKVLFLVLSLILTVLCSVGKTASEKELRGLEKELSPIYASLAEEIVKLTGLKKGICLDIGSGSGFLAIELAKRTELSIYGLEPDDKMVELARKQIDANGLYGLRVSVEKGSIEQLPYSDYCANLIISGDMFLFGTRGRSAREILRVLKPGGIAYLGQPAEAARYGKALTAEELRQWLKDGGVKQFEIIEKNGVWAKITQARPEGADDWTHIWYDATNSGCSKDKLIKSPFRTLWCGDVSWQQGVSANGRVFTRLYEGGGLGAFDAYNGLKLWVRKIEAVGGPAGGGPSWKAAPWEVVAIGDTVYVAAGNSCLVLDAATGETKDTYSLPNLSGNWEHLSWSNGLLYGCAGGKVFAVEGKSGKPRWVCKGEKVNSGSISIGGELIYFSEEESVVALDALTGQERWRTNPGERKMKVNNTTYSNGILYCYPQRRLIALSAREGKFLWDISFNKHPPVISEDTIYSLGDGYVGAFDAKTGKPKEFKATRGGGCGPGASSGSCLFCRSGFTAVYDMTKGGEKTVYGGFRSGCVQAGIIPANGLVHVLSCHCTCPHPIHSTMTLIPGERVVAPKEPLLERYAEISFDNWKDFTPQKPVVEEATGVNPWSSTSKGTVTSSAIVAGAVYFGSSDHKVYCLEATNGKVRWSFFTGGPVSITPTIWKGRVFFGSDDGWVYCLEASIGKLLWRLRAAPGDRKIIDEGQIISAWPVRTGVLIDEDVAYFGAGFSPPDGVYIYAINPENAKVIWMSEKFLGWISPQRALFAFRNILYVPSGRDKRARPAKPAAFARKSGEFLGVAGGSHMTIEKKAKIVVDKDLTQKVIPPPTYSEVSNKEGEEFEFFGIKWVNFGESKITKTSDGMLHILTQREYEEVSGIRTKLPLDFPIRVEIKGKLRSYNDRISFGLCNEKGVKAVAIFAGGELGTRVYWDTKRNAPLTGWTDNITDLSEPMFLDGFYYIQCTLSPEKNVPFKGIVMNEEKEIIGRDREPKEMIPYSHPDAKYLYIGHTDSNMMNQISEVKISSVTNR